MNPFHRINGELFAEGVALDRIAAEFGTPTYIYSSQAIETRAAAWHAAFAPVAPLICFAVKANGNLSVLRSMNAMSLGADIVSGGELARALAAGISADRIVFSGVGKRADELIAALDAGVHSIDVESTAEFDLLEKIATDRGLIAPVAIRINPDVETGTAHAYTATASYDTKFGVPPTEAIALARRAAASPSIGFNGLSVHIGSQVVDASAWTPAFRALSMVAQTLVDQGIAVPEIDVGGGLAVPYGVGDESGDLVGFAEKVISLAAKFGAKIIVEPGRHLIAEAGILLVRVIRTKETPRRRFVIVDGAMNDLIRPALYDAEHEVEPVIMRDGDPHIVDVVGPVCETGDFLAHDRAMVMPVEGDLLAIHTVGAYGMSMASRYNSRPLAAEVMVEGATARLIRRRESVADLMAHELDLPGN